MFQQINRVFVEKREIFNTESSSLLRELKQYLGITELQKVRMLNRYDIAGIKEEEYRRARDTVFSDPATDLVYEENLNLNPGCRVFAVEYLPGQYDLRADAAAQCVQILTTKDRPLVSSARVIILEGNITEEEYQRIKEYCINPVECREDSLQKPCTLKPDIKPPQEVDNIEDFSSQSKSELQRLSQELDLSLEIKDLSFCQEYFTQKRREPTITEIKLIDTYWSDHCRHTTFNTAIDDISIEEGQLSSSINNAFREYLKSREFVYGKEANARDICLMDLATIFRKELKTKGMLQELEESEEVNASSIIITVDLGGKEKEEWLVMFKNETHNHPTEIEPFGGAATCLGGCIRDPLSGRSYAYQAMRITGSGDPRTGPWDTLPGKLSQRKITTKAAEGFSSYGNQVGLATGQVAELYHNDYAAKRMEIGFVIGAAPRHNVIRQSPSPGDAVLLLGGRTGRDGCGGASGSSREHTEKSLFLRGTEVQKGNAPEERKIQRLFRNPAASKLIKKANDFGAGGISVAIGELADGVEVDLDAVPQKYEGLDGTELAISESQERMAVVVDPQHAAEFIKLAEEENLECTQVAEVTSRPLLRMNWKGKTIVDLDRDFLNSSGIKKHARAEVQAPRREDSYFCKLPAQVENELPDIKKAWLANLGDLNVCSQKGLVERFDSTVGAGTVLLPFGGKYQDTPTEGMAAKIPLVEGQTNTATITTFGFNPHLSQWSPFHGAVYALVEAAAKNVSLGGDYANIKMTFQEYFEKLGEDPLSWGKPLSSLLGAYWAQKHLGIPSVGGKDSMSGSFNDLHVPPTLVAFAVNTADSRNILSQEFKRVGSKVVLVPALRDKEELPRFEILKQNFAKVNQLIHSGIVLSAHTVTRGGIAAAVSKMSFGNRIGFSLSEVSSSSSEQKKPGTAGEIGDFLSLKELFLPHYGSIILEIEEEAELDKIFGEINYVLLGYTVEEELISLNGVNIGLKEALNAWKTPLEHIFPTGEISLKGENIPELHYYRENILKPGKQFASPRVFMPVFPGTNCEYETTRAFEKAGAQVDTLVFKNLTPALLHQSLSEMIKRIDRAQILMIPGGFSAGDEPDGSGKFIAAVFRNPHIQDSVMKLLERDGLILGICNGFQALIRLGLLPYGEFRQRQENSPALAFNWIGRHVSRMVRTKVLSNLSPWLAEQRVGDIHTIALSHGEGKFTAKPQEIENLFKQGQIATQYVDLEGKPSSDIISNPNSSEKAIEGITSPDGRIFGKMAHSERTGPQVNANVPGEKEQSIFRAGTAYFL